MHHHRNPNALVLASSGLQGHAAIGPPSQQEQGDLNPVTHASEINTSYFHCREDRSYFPYFNYEIVKVQTWDHNVYTHQNTFHILNFPIDQLGEHLVEEATRLLNLRRITFYNPLSWEVFILNYKHVTEMALHILSHVPLLTRITLCADMLNDQLFRVLCSLSCLREVEILLPTISFDWPNRLVKIGEELNRGVPRLQQVEYFKIPLELVTGALLFSLGRLPRLYFLKTAGSANDAPYPGRSFIACMGHLHVQNQGLFRRLQLLDVRDNVLQEDFFSKDTLSRIFPNTKFIKT